MKTTFRAPDPARKTFTALPTSWLWPGGPPIWQISTLGAAVALTSVAVPALPTVLPDKPPPVESPAAAGPEQTEQPKTEKPAASDPTSIPTVSALTPTSDPGRTPSKAPKGTSAVPAAEDAPDPTGSPGPTPTASIIATKPPTEVEPTTDAPAPQPESVTIAATDAKNKRWLVTATDCAGCVSGSRIVGLGLLATLTVPVEADSAGTRQLTIAYETRRERDLYVSVNGGAPQKLALAGTGGWDKPGWGSLSVDLQQGANSIKFHNPLGLAPDLDQITVS